MIRYSIVGSIIAAASLILVPEQAAYAVPIGIDVAVPAYVNPGNTMDTNLANASPAASVIVMNTDNGSGGHVTFDSTWQAQADTFRAMTDYHANHTKVIGYVDTNYTASSLSTVEAWIDDYMNSGHVDGIFFDRVTDSCGTNNVNRNYYETLRNYVLNKLSTALVVDNPGTAIADCYFETGHQTADTFVTYEGTYSDYTSSLLTGSSWAHGNVYNGSGTRLGNEYNTGHTFWHLIYATPNSTTNMHTTINLAWGREAGLVYTTDDSTPNPWDGTPGWSFSTETAYAASTWEP